MIKTIKFHEKCFKLLNSWSITFEFFDFMKTLLNFTNSWIRYSTFSNFKENTFIEHVKNKFEDKLSKSNFYIKWNSFDIKYEVCLTIVQNHALKCLGHWNGLQGDVRALIPC